MERLDEFGAPLFHDQSGEVEQPENLAVALDPAGRLRFGRSPDEWGTWVTGARVPEYLIGLAELATFHNRDGFSVELGTFLAESIEYAAVRVAIALDGPERRWRGGA